jgi:hypothetical protein
MKKDLRAMAKRNNEMSSRRHSASLPPFGVNVMMLWCQDDFAFASGFQLRVRVYEDRTN